MKSFTLIETLIAIFIFTLALGAVFSAVLFSYKIHGYTYQQSMAIDETQRGISEMIKEIREAKTGEDGSYLIESAGDKEFIFYSDIDKDGAVEKVRYFWATVSSGNDEKECVSFLRGGVCEVDFSNFSQGNITNAEIKVSVEGDFGWSTENADVFLNGDNIGGICDSECSDCAGIWQGSVVFDVTEQAQTGNLNFLIDATNWVDAFCTWEDPWHSMKAKFELSWEEELESGGHEFKKGVINPTLKPVKYLEEDEEITVISSYVRNAPPIFEYYYFDENDNQLKKIEQYPARLVDTELMKVLLIVNVDPNRAPQDFELETYVNLRNLKNGP